MKFHALLTALGLLTVAFSTVAAISTSNGTKALFDDETSILFGNGTQPPFINSTRLLYSNGTRPPFINGTTFPINNGTIRLHNNDATSLAVLRNSSTIHFRINGTWVLTDNGTALLPLYGPLYSTHSQVSNATLASNIHKTATSISSGVAGSTSSDMVAPDRNGTVVADNSGKTNFHCDAQCAHRFIFHAAYNAASDGMRTVFDVCDAHHWCPHGAKEFCKGIVESDLTAIASQVKSEVTAGMDYNNINNLTMISTILTVTARSSRTAISVTQSLLESRDHACPADKVVRLEKLRWFMAQQEGEVDYDANGFDEYIANQDVEILQKRGSGPCIGDSCICDNMSWFRRVLQGAKRLLSKLKLKMLQNATKQPTPPTWSEEEVNYRENFEPWWKGEDFLKNAMQQGGPQRAEEWLDRVPNSFEPVPRDFLGRHGTLDPIRPPRIFPMDFAEGVPAEDIPVGGDHNTEMRPPTPPPVDTGPEGRIPFERPPVISPPEADIDYRPPIRPETHAPPVDTGRGRTLRLNRFERLPPFERPEVNPLELPASEWPYLGLPSSEWGSLDVPETELPLELYRAEVFNPITNAMEEITVTPSVEGRTPAHVLQRARELGYEANLFDELDGFGDYHQTRTLNPDALQRTPGEWYRWGDRFVRQQWNLIKGQAEPVLDSLGQPLIATPKGVFMNVVPVVDNLGANFVDAFGSIGSAFSLFSPGAGGGGAGSPASEATVLYDPVSKSLDISDPISLPFLEGPPAMEAPLPVGGPFPVEGSPAVDAPPSLAAPPSPGGPSEEGGSQQSHGQSSGGDPEDTVVHEGEDFESESDKGEGGETAKTVVPETDMPQTNAHQATAAEAGASTPTPPKASPPKENAPATTAPETAASAGSDASNEELADTSAFEDHPPTTASPTNAPQAPEEAQETLRKMGPDTQAPSIPAETHAPGTAGIDDRLQTSASPMSPPPTPTEAQEATGEMRSSTRSSSPHAEITAPSDHSPTATSSVTAPPTLTEAREMIGETRTTTHGRSKHDHTGLGPDNDHQPTPTTLAKATKTKAKTPKFRHGTPIITPGAKITGCQSLDKCPICNSMTECRIGNLPPACVRNALQISGLKNSGHITWDKCVSKIRALNREEAKAWAYAISDDSCVSRNEWNPLEVSKSKRGECLLNVWGPEFAKVKDVWITGLLPIGCPRYQEGVSNRITLRHYKCHQIVEVLHKPWDPLKLGMLKDRLPALRLAHEPTLTGRKRHDGLEGKGSKVLAYLGLQRLFMSLLGLLPIF